MSVILVDGNWRSWSEWTNAVKAAREKLVSELDYVTIRHRILAENRVLTSQEKPGRVMYTRAQVCLR